MDIRSLIDSDASGSASKAPVVSPGPRKEPMQQFKPPDQFKTPHDIHQGYRERGPEPQRSADRGSGIEPPHVPPLRPPSYEEFRSPSAASYNSAQSPYQKTPSSALGTSQYPFPQPSIHSPAHSAHSAQHYQFESQPFAINSAQQGPGQPSSLPQTPTSGTLGGSYPSYQQHRPSSSHSASTPTSGHTQTPTFLRDSPQQSHAQVRGQYVSQSSQQYLSQPGTPLGPPTTLGRQGSSLRRESPGLYDHKRTNSGGSYGQHQQPIQPSSNAMGGHFGPPPAPYDPIHAQPALQQNSPVTQDRERSLSVSPKTRLPSQPHLHIDAATSDPVQTSSSQETPLKRKMGDSRMDEPSPQQQPSAKRSMSLGVGGMLNASYDDDASNRRNQSDTYYRKYGQEPPHGEAPHLNRERHPSSNQEVPPAQSSMPSANQQSLVNESPVVHSAISRPSRHPSYESHVPAQSSTSTSTPVIPSPSVSDHASGLGGHSMTGLATAPEPRVPGPSPKASARRIRYREVPIFAQSARQKGWERAQVNGQRPVVGRSSSLLNQQPPAAIPQPPARQEANGRGMPSAGAPQSELDPAGLLGPWEPTITNVIPAEELTREIMNYLFQTVVQMNGVAFGPAGGSNTVRGAVVEIEAKIGQIIDRNTNDRLRLPVMTECMLSRTDPNLRTAFRSSMTASQHSRLNAFLNNALMSSKPAPPGEPPKKPRVPLDYVHTYETDTFYDVSQNALSTLPPAVQNYLDRNNKPKVRITTDQKTNQVTAKIIKVRISDVEVYSPLTPFDWRVSVSLEVNYDGDMRDLVETTEGKDRRRTDRNKDRVSYKHSHYQIDLTQVKPAETTSKTEKEHELEVELSSAAVREQGLLVLQRQPNKYEELIKGFVDNVRTLVRHCRD
ncbi:MAG: hypothetical protein LQ338_006920 [Usnochroma carphineum]|nr:MAG: hypothetical protein LQ338_006920 [Usnochroma carphineum]